MVLNGNAGKWTLWLAGVIVTLLMFGIGLLANGVVQNERRGVDERTKIRAEHKSDMEKMQTYIGQEFKELRITQTAQYVEIMRELKK